MAATCMEETRFFSILAQTSVTFKVFKLHFLQLLHVRTFSVYLTYTKKVNNTQHDQTYFDSQLANITLYKTFSITL